MRNALEGLLKPEEREIVLGEAEVLQLFKVSKVGTIAGCIGAERHHPADRARRASSATASRSTPARSRSLKRFKDDVREVREGLECGIGIENFNDIKVGDRIESFRMEEIKRTPASRRPAARWGDRRHPGVGAASAGAVIRSRRSAGPLKPLTAALRQTLNVSVAETGHQDLWQRAEIACAAVGSARPVVEETLRAADRAIEEADGVRIVDTVTVWR